MLKHGEVYYIDANGGSPVDTIQATCQNINEEWHTCLSSTDKAFKKQMPSLASNSYNALVTVVINCNDENLPEDVEHLCKGVEFTRYTFESRAIHAVDHSFEVEEICFA